MDQFSLAAEFPPPSEAEWLAVVAKTLRDAPFGTLRSRLHEGFRTEPLYTQAVRRAPVFGSRGWLIVQPLTGSEEQLADDLANGTNALFIDFDAGLAGQSAEQLKVFLGSDIPYFVAPGSPAADAALLLGAMPDSSKPAGTAGLDPLTALALSGERPVERSALLSNDIDAAFYIREHFPSFVPFLASGHAWEGAGGSAVQELAFTLAAAVSYWRALAEAGMPLPESAGCIGFSLSATADIFLTMAKFRAMRLLWGRALDAAGEKPRTDLLLLAKMSQRILTAYDPHVNLLRGTAAAFGAALGGATGIQVVPFDSAGSGATAFSRRIARNTSLVLQEESYLSAVADAAAGSAYVETLTDELASAAWTLFREVEAKGGLAAAIESGFVQDALQSKSHERQNAIACRRDKITGVSVFPNLAEQASFPNKAAQPEAHPFAGILPKLPAPAKGERFAALAAAARAGASLRALRTASRRVATHVARPLSAPARDAAPFEMLRRRADTALETIGSRPPIFLALLGKPEEFRARTSWVQGFFSAGGIEVIVPDHGFESAETLAAEFKQSPAPVACLCSSNKGYTAVAGAAAALKKAGAVAVYLAGPAAVLKALDPQDAAAVDRLIFEGCNVLAVLQEAQAALRVEELSEAAENEAAEAGFEVNTRAHSHD